jgi:3,4-dihydroxy 2-butanone 4-phosphate synthase / GTP cyclohydrolase II
MGHSRKNRPNNHTTINPARASAMSNVVLSTVEEIIDEARNGRMFILVDDEDRENEGDLVIPAQMATPDAINFMAKYGRGLICLTLTRQRVEQLGLGPMADKNQTRHETAFTVAIEARHGVTTGISAADRARTISVAIDASKGREDIVSPGHVFPLMARDGGVLVRAGHTEAAVDVARLAGLNPSGVICEIMKDDGTMARLDDLLLFAEQHKLKIGTIRDLIAYRFRYDHLVQCVGEIPFTSEWGGEWACKVYLNKATGAEHLALVKGQINANTPTVVRMHAPSFFADSFGEASPRRHLLSQAMSMIGQHGAGVVVVINQTTSTMFSSMVNNHPVGTLGNADNQTGLRDYGTGAQILADLGVHDMILLTNSKLMPVALAGYGLKIIEQRSIPLTLT